MTFSEKLTSTKVPSVLIREASKLRIGGLMLYFLFVDHMCCIMQFVLFYGCNVSQYAAILCIGFILRFANNDVSTLLLETWTAIRSSNTASTSYEKWLNLGDKLGLTGSVIWEILWLNSRNWNKRKDSWNDRLKKHKWNKKKNNVNMMR